MNLVSVFLSMFWSWGPILFIAIIWIIFMQKLRRKQDDYSEHMKKQHLLMEKYIATTERIAIALEKHFERINQ